LIGSDRHNFRPGTDVLIQLNLGYRKISTISRTSR